jgi:hypothetical protein
MSKIQGKVVTLWLQPEAVAFVQQCMEGDVFLDLSDFFETVLTVFREHSHALVSYVDQEEAKGFTHAEIFGLLKTEVTFRRL